MGVLGRRAGAADSLGKERKKGKARTKGNGLYLLAVKKKATAVARCL